MKTAEVIGRQIACDVGCVTALSRCMNGPGILRTFAVLLFWSATVFGEDWKIIRQQGRDYVTFANVAAVLSISRIHAREPHGFTAQRPPWHSCTSRHKRALHQRGAFLHRLPDSHQRRRRHHLGDGREQDHRPDHASASHSEWKESGYGRARSGPWWNRSGRGQSMGHGERLCPRCRAVGQRAA